MNINKSKISKLLSGITQIVLLVVLVLFITSLQRKNHRTICKSIDIQLNTNGYGWIEEVDIHNLITFSGQQPIINQSVENIDLRQLEGKLKSSSYVSMAEAQLNIQGDLFVQVDLKAVRYRIINNEGVHYYIDNNGLRLPFSDNFTPNVPVVQGYIPMVDTVFSEKINNGIWETIEFIEKDDVWESFIGSVYVDEDKRVWLVPILDEHNILIGDSENLEEKMNNLKVFYKQALVKTDWNKYKTIDTRYKDQVICKKKNI